MWTWILFADNVKSGDVIFMILEYNLGHVGSFFLYFQRFKYKVSFTPFRISFWVAKVSATWNVKYYWHHISTKLLDGTGLSLRSFTFTPTDA